MAAHIFSIPHQSDCIRDIKAKIEDKMEDQDFESQSVLNEKSSEITSEINPTAQQQKEKEPDFSSGVEINLSQSHERLKTHCVSSLNATRPDLGGGFPLAASGLVSSKVAGQKIERISQSLKRKFPNAEDLSENVYLSCETVKGSQQADSRGVVSSLQDLESDALTTPPRCPLDVDRAYLSSNR
ncbi:hypothetical protein ElyMa_006581200 [Elysia marginata]|uniref:Uncharacterized protein n=1 Tax=Elysia marginata TaxID=1093978 RepID=A0AAV4ICD6_9GAST|nr:hypothetical protein ElyMa_006581200 [Elysia marginata]